MLCSVAAQLKQLGFLLSSAAFPSNYGDGSVFAWPVAWALINTGLYGGPMFTSHFCDPLLGRKKGEKK